VPRSTRTLLTALAVVIIASVTYASLRVWNYTQHDPGFCRTCHLMEASWEKWETSAHSRVECHACHQQSIVDNMTQLAKFIALQPETIEKHAEVDYEKCAACHLSNDPRWLQVVATNGHVVHFGRLGLECVGCHSRGVHRFVRPIESCRECHGEIVMKAARMEAVHCTACHGFLAAEGTLEEPGRESCLECHTELAGFDDSSPHAQFVCGQCHKPHEKRQPTSGDCGGCHQVEGPGLHAHPGHAQCITCHAPHGWKTQARLTCESCHSDRLDHYPDAGCPACHSFAAGETEPGAGDEGAAAAD
jgi:hypothetical protein